MCNGSYHVMPFVVSEGFLEPPFTLVYSLARFLGGTAAYTVKLAFTVWGLLLHFQHYYVHSFCSHTGQIVTQTGNKGQKERPKSRKQFVWPNTFRFGWPWRAWSRQCSARPRPLGGLQALPSSGYQRIARGGQGFPVILLCKYVIFQ